VLGADAVLSRAKVPIEDHLDALAVTAGGVAACLGAAALFRLAHDQNPMRELRVSAWTLEQLPDIVAGSTKPANVPPTIDVGDVALIGAGAVAAALAYWLRQIGFSGQWSVVDGDIVVLHNTNRGMLFLPLHAGWQDGELVIAKAVTKASVVAETLGAKSFPVWYDEWLTGSRRRYDLILPLANEHGVRHSIASLHEPILLHSSTSQSGAAQLHRQIPGRDDCLDCRLPEMKSKVVQFTCSTAHVKVEDGTSTDAALPFLSAAAGLMLAIALLRLQAGELVSGEENFWEWNFLSKHGFASRGVSSCDDACMALLPEPLRRQLNEKKRWWTAP
jgi:hypothetical protein